jgi:glycosyltransferase involved in cell wall biosynthesis
MRRLRIAYAAINTNRRDGGARALSEVAERLAHRHEVHLFSRTVEDLDLSCIRWHRMPGPGWPAVAEFSGYHLLAEAKIRARDFDIIHSIGNNAAAANVITIPNIQPAKRPFLAETEAQVNLLRRLSHWLFLTVTSAVEGRVYSYRPGQHKTPPLFLPCSRGVERELKTHYGIGPAPVRVIPNAADIDLFKPLAPEEKARWREASGLSIDDIILVFAGGEWSRKGLEFALGALARIPQPEVKLLVLGHDAAAPRFVELADRLGIRSRVFFAGFRRDVAKGMGASDVFLFPSRYEAFSLATIEAAACGLPLVATRINGAEDFISPGHNGFFIKHNPEQIVRTLRPLLASPDLRRTMGQTARRHVEQHYTWDRVADLTETAYFEYLGLDAGKQANQAAENGLKSK